MAVDEKCLRVHVLEDVLVDFRDVVISAVDSEVWCRRCAGAFLPEVFDVIVFALDGGNFFLGPPVKEGLELFEGLYVVVFFEAVAVAGDEMKFFEPIEGVDDSGFREIGFECYLLSAGILEVKNSFQDTNLFFVESEMDKMLVNTKRKWSTHILDNYSRDSSIACDY